MSENSRPTKRARTDERSTHRPQAATERHYEFWLDDGNIVLVARENVAFRVYRGLLAAQSTVFEDMFASSSPLADESFDGCPLVRLSDSSMELAHLLRVILPKTQQMYVPSSMIC